MFWLRGWEWGSRVHFRTFGFNYFFCVTAQHHGWRVCFQLGIEASGLTCATYIANLNEDDSLTSISLTSFLLAVPWGTGSSLFLGRLAPHNFLGDLLCQFFGRLAPIHFVETLAVPCRLAFLCSLRDILRIIILGALLLFMLLKRLLLVCQWAWFLIIYCLGNLLRKIPWSSPCPSFP